jgi:hypothetical protein
MENETRRSLGGGTPSPRSESSKSRNEYVVCLRYMIQVKGDADCDDDVVVREPVVILSRVWITLIIFVRS